MAKAYVVIDCGHAVFCSLDKDDATLVAESLCSATLEEVYMADVITTRFISPGDLDSDE